MLILWHHTRRCLGWNYVWAGAVKQIKKKLLMIGFNGISGIFWHQLYPRTQFHLSGRRRSGLPAGYARPGRQDDGADIQSFEIVGSVTWTGNFYWKIEMSSKQK